MTTTILLKKFTQNQKSVFLKKSLLQHLIAMIFINRLIMKFGD